ncbi:hypothetical protein CLV79_10935 [Limimaricola soesokkakensis]|uniref:Uncharacterized protein n=1 Tax=Limimaricola soesokkakensis TaxID=1343159 RepID=A0A1X6ZRN6_9RHOB|nr:hypothetical protein CLV79_10935 [Limimaricola soesokkakensis]SLN59624.1 hypothetical protein LOS8367_02862 [Limimaricola soesokkakensis]
MNCYTAKRPWSDRYHPKIRHIVGAQLLDVAADSFD